MRVLFASFLSVMTVASCQLMQVEKSFGQDPYQWLEEIDSPRSLDKVNAWNKRTTSELESDPRYASIEADVRKILLATDRIPFGAIEGGWVYNFWQDQKNVRGLWRRTRLAEYRKAAPKWETVLDLDRLAQKESENWVWKGANCLQPAYRRCLLKLSRGGKDAAVIREFDIERKSFVAKGFNAPEAKTEVAWIDRDRIFISTNFGEGSLTKSGYARQVHIWSRHQDLMKAEKVYEVSEDDVAASPYVNVRPDGRNLFLIREINSVDTEVFHLSERRQLMKLPIPSDSSFSGVYRGKVLVIIRKDLEVGGRKFKSGALLAWKLSDLQAAPTLVYEPSERESIQGTYESMNVIYLNIMSNVKSRIMSATHMEDAWKIEKVGLPQDGSISVLSVSAFTNEAMFSYSGFLTPNSVLHLASPTARVLTLRSMPARFDASGLVTEQFEATSKDGVKIPYFVVRAKDFKYDGKNPTVINAYGGFNISQRPFYMGSIGKVFSEAGGVYVLANIRGGGEFGPKWHEAARLKNRQKAFDDFIAVAEELIERRITSPRHLGIQGGSNGGLLVGVAFTQRPDLFNAVLCEVPLADMLRYHKLLAGASWMGEYGNPDDPEMAPILRAYSPYHNLVGGKTYPRVFFITSTRDDRVHPAHARKMAAKMEELGAPFMYFENTEGGHSAAANLEQRIKFSALEWTYVWRQLK